MFFALLTLSIEKFRVEKVRKYLHYLLKKSIFCFFIFQFKRQCQQKPPELESGGSADRPLFFLRVSLAQYKTLFILIL
jgi:hypothetical protein